MSLYFLAKLLSSNTPTQPTVEALALLTGLKISLGIIILTQGALIYFTVRFARLKPKKHKTRLVKYILASSDISILLGGACIVSNEILVNGKTLLTHVFLISLLVMWFWIVKEQYVRRRPFWDELRETLSTTSSIFLLAGTLAFYVSDPPHQSNILLTWIWAFLLIPLSRTSIRSLLDRLNIWEVSALIIGTGDNAREAYLAIEGEINIGYKIIGFVSLSASTANEISIGTHKFPVFNGGSDIIEKIKELGHPEIIVAVDNLSAPENQNLIRNLSSYLSNFHIIPSIRGLPLFGTEMSHFFSHEVLLLTTRNSLTRRSYRWLKRIFDIFFSSLIFILVLPLMAYVAWQIWREDNSPFIFTQTRVGADGKLFELLKFRSMVTNAEEILHDWRASNAPEWQTYNTNNFKIANDPRVLSIGKWIRSNSIDELPQLINVFRGEMSLVGPRPLLSRELNQYGQNIVLYEKSKPGLTGLWQISGRSETTFSERSELDAWYIRNSSIWYDIAIIFKTLKVVLNKHGAY